MPVVTQRLAVAATLAAVVVLALPASALWLGVVNALLLATAVADFSTAVDPRALTVRRDLPPRMQIDGDGEVRWRVSAPTGNGRRAVVVELADDFVPSLRAATRRARLRVPAGGSAQATVAIRPARRGRFAPTTITLRSYGRLGLAARQRDVDVPGRMLVLPAFPSRRQAELRISRTRLADVGERVSRGRGARGEFDSLREYTVDDEFDRIDWVATARARAPVVRTYRAERNQTVLVLVDTGRTMAGRVGDVPRLDHALDAAMGLTMVATRLGDRAGVVVFDESVRAVVPPRGRRDQLNAVSDVLAEAHPRLVEADYRAAFTTTLARFRRRALLVVLSDLSPGSVEQTLLPALALVARDHEVIVAAVSDPSVQRWAAGQPTEAATAFLAASAAAELARRRELSHQLAAAGARVVDVQPGDLTGALADAYLRLKSSGRL